MSSEEDKFLPSESRQASTALPPNTPHPDEAQYLPKEFQQQAKPGLMGDLSEYLKAAMQNGVTAGPGNFGDRMAGLGKAAVDTIAEGPINHSWGDTLDRFKHTYENTKNEQRGEANSAMEHHPIPATLGGIGLSAMGMPFMAGSQLAKGANMIPRIAEGMKTGAKLGTVMGLGDSPDLTNLKSDVEHMGNGMAGGTVVGGLVPPGIAALKGTAGGIYDYGIQPLTKKVAGPIGSAYNLGRQGIDLIGEKGTKLLNQNILDFVNGVAPKFKGVMDNLAKTRGQALTAADELGIKADPNKVRDLIQPVMDDPNLAPGNPTARTETGRLQDILQEHDKGVMTRRTKMGQNGPSDLAKYETLVEHHRAVQDLLNTGVNPDDIELVSIPHETPGNSTAIVRQSMRDPATGDFNGKHKALARGIVPDYQLPSNSSTEMVRTNPSDLSSLSDLQGMKNNVNAVGQFGPKSMTQQGPLRQAGGIAQGINGIMTEAVPQIGTINDALGSGAKAAQAIGVPDTHINVGNDQIADNQVSDKMLGLLNSIPNEDSAAGQKGVNKMQKFLGHAQDMDNSMNSMDPNSPTFPTDPTQQPLIPMQGGQNIADLHTKFQDLAHQLNVAREIQQRTGGGSRDWFNATRYLGTGVAHLTGLGVNAAAEGLSNAAGDVAQGVKSATPKVLSDIANHIVQSQGAQNMGQGMQNLVTGIQKAASAGAQDQNKVLFGFLQNPGYRKILHGYIPDDEK